MLRNIKMERFPCPLLKMDVLLSDERESHIAERHPEFYAKHRSKLPETLAEPRQLRLSWDGPTWRPLSHPTLVFCRSYPDLDEGDHVFVFVSGRRYVRVGGPGEISWSPPAIVTAYPGRVRYMQWDLAWSRD